MSKEGVYNSGLVLRNKVYHFWEHLSDYSEEQTTDFLESIYAASQNRIIKGKRLVANDIYPNTEVLNKAINNLFE